MDLNIGFTEFPGRRSVHFKYETEFLTRNVDRGNSTLTVGTKDKEKYKGHNNRLGYISGLLLYKASENGASSHITYS